MNKYFVVFLLAVCLMVPCVAQADGFDFQYLSNDGASSASGYLWATANGGGSFTAVSSSGAVYQNSNLSLINDPMSLVFNPGGTGVTTSPLGDFNYDNQLFPAQADLLIDSWGLLFSMPGVEINLFGNGGAVYQDYVGVSPPATFTYSSLGTFTLTAVPEPGSILLMGTLLLGVAGALKRKLG
jgi:hypothetical protein